MLSKIELKLMKNELVKNLMESLFPLVGKNKMGGEGAEKYL